MELRAYLRPLLKWWWLILISTLLAGMTSYFAVSQQPPVYQARVALIIGSAINNPNPSGYDFWLSQQLAQTYSDIAQRDIVRTAVMDELGLTWLPAYTAQPVGDTQLLEIRVNDSVPERAMVVANELANQLILRTPTSGGQQGDADRQAFIKQQLDELELKIAETNSEIIGKQNELAGLFSARQISDLQGQIRALEGKQDALQANYASMLASSSQGATNRLSVIEPATLPVAPIGPEVLMTVITAAAIGFSLGVAAAYLMEYLDDTIKNPEDIRRVADLPTLTGISDTKDVASAPNSPITFTNPRSPIAEAYRSLRTAVLFTNVDQTTRSIVVTSAGPQEGKSHTSANLAVVLAQSSHRVLLIDADLRRPTQHKLFNKQITYGLTNLLLDMPASFDSSRLGDMYSQLSLAIKATPIQGLFLMTTGDLPPNPAELVGSARMKSLIKALMTRFDFIIIDTPPVLAVTDAVVLGTRVDSVVLVARSGNTRQSQMKQAVLMLREVNANISGVVLNRINKQSGEYYYHYYNSYYPAANDKDDKPKGDSGTPTAEGQTGDAAWRHKPARGFLARLLS